MQDLALYSTEGAALGQQWVTVAEPGLCSGVSDSSPDGVLPFSL